jgi:hypothetical protein
MFNQTLRDRQSQSRAFVGGIFVSLNLPEFLKDDRLILSSNTYPGVGDGYRNLSPIFDAVNVDSAILWREFNRVAKQVIENLLKADSIGIDWKIRLDLVPNLDIFVMASGRMVERTSGKASLTGKSSHRSSSCPASILERSKMSLINCNRWAEPCLM